MKEIRNIQTYEQLDRFTKDWINQEIKENKNNDKMTPESLFSYIYYSEGDDETLANIMQVSRGLIRAIKK